MDDAARISRQILDSVANKRSSFIEAKVTYLIGQEAAGTTDQPFEAKQALWKRHFKEISELISSLEQLIRACSLAQNQLTRWQSPEWIHASGVIAKYHEELRELKDERKVLRLWIPIEKRERTGSGVIDGNSGVVEGRSTFLE